MREDVLVNPIPDAAKSAAIAGGWFNFSPSIQEDTDSPRKY
jgi:hypothetical protein